MKDKIAANLHRPEFNSIWAYKGKFYQVNTVMERNLIQFEDAWWPTVRYTEYPQTDLVFYRALPDFIRKFNEHPMP